MEQKSVTAVGRFAPSPTGRMHLGNVFAALVSWLSVRSRGGRWILRIEDLDPQRSRREYAAMIEDDLHWLGLDWDEGGLAGRGPAGPYSQSLRCDIYEAALDRLKATGLLYRCRCTRADIMATQAPHQSDGRIIYAGTCRPDVLPQPWRADGVPGAIRLAVPDCDISFTDRICGDTTVNLARHCGDFVVKRADGAWSYQLAVTVDDEMMGVTEIVRGNDLLLSVAQQNYLRQLLGYRPVEYAHLPLLCNTAGQRLSKRDGAMSMEALRRRHTAPEIIGYLAGLLGLSHDGAPRTAASLVELYADSLVPRCGSITAVTGPSVE